MSQSVLLLLYQFINEQHILLTVYAYIVDVEHLRDKVVPAITYVITAINTSHVL